MQNPKKLEIDWNMVIDDKPSPEFLITTTTGDAKKSETEYMDDGLQWMAERELKDWILKYRTNIPKLGPKLPDHGQKLKLKLKLFEDELERRNFLKQLKKTGSSELKDRILRIRANIPMLSPKLPDHGRRLKLKLKHFEDELERHNFLQLKKTGSSELKDRILRIRANIPMLSPKLPDHGRRLKLKLKLFEDELERHNFLQLKKTGSSELKDRILRIRANIPILSPKLPDHGQRLKLKLKLFEDELERRNFLQIKKEEEC